MKWLDPGLPWPNFYRIFRLITSLGPRRTGPRTLKIQIFNNCKNKIFIFCKDSSWEQTNEPIELKPPSSIDDVIKPVQPNPYNAFIPESTHSSNVSYTSTTTMVSVHGPVRATMLKHPNQKLHQKNNDLFRLLLCHQNSTLIHPQSNIIQIKRIYKPNLHWWIQMMN